MAAQLAEAPTPFDIREFISGDRGFVAEQLQGRRDEVRRLRGKSGRVLFVSTS